MVNMSGNKQDCLSQLVWDYLSESMESHINVNVKNLSLRRMTIMHNLTVSGTETN